MLEFLKIMSQYPCDSNMLEFVKTTVIESIGYCFKIIYCREDKSYDHLQYLGFETMASRKELLHIFFIFI